MNTSCSSPLEKELIGNYIPQRVHVRPEYQPSSYYEKDYGCMNGHALKIKYFLMPTMW